MKIASELCNIHGINTSQLTNIARAIAYWLLAHDKNMINTPQNSDLSSIRNDYGTAKDPHYQRIT
ncbi:MAG: hypothetical protein ACTH3B_04920, partial [Pseudoalteromonas sp.]